jgi:hypothetical protein
MNKYELSMVASVVLFFASMIYGAVGYCTVMYPFHQEVYSNLEVACQATNPEISLQHLEIALDHPLWDDLDTPIGVIGIVKPTITRTLYREHALLKGIRERYILLIKAYKPAETDYSLELNRFTIPESEMERIKDEWKKIEVSAISNAWAYKNARWYFWLDPWCFGIITLLWFIYPFFLVAIDDDW